MFDNDWPVGLRIWTEDDEKRAPKHDKPEAPSDKQKEDHRKQVEDERSRRHPSEDVVEPPYEPEDPAPFEED